MDISWCIWSQIMITKNCYLRFVVLYLTNCDLKMDFLYCKNGNSRPRRNLLPNCRVHAKYLTVKYFIGIGNRSTSGNNEIWSTVNGKTWLSITNIHIFILNCYLFFGKMILTLVCPRNLGISFLSINRFSGGQWWNIQRSLPTQYCVISCKFNVIYILQEHYRDITKQ